MNEQYSFTNIIIQYPANVQVAGETGKVVHAVIRGENVTFCKRRPLRFTICDESGESTTCPGCLKGIAELPLIPPEVSEDALYMEHTYQPRPEDHGPARITTINGLLLPGSPPPQRTTQPGKPKRKRKKAPKVQEERSPAFGLSRTWLLTQKGLDYLAALEAKERATK